MPKTQERHFFIVVNFNSGKTILECIHSILQSTNIHPMIIIIDNASRDASLEDCKNKFPNLIYIYNSHNIGFGAAANIGIRYALERNASTITLCNPDAVLNKNCAQKLISIVQTKKAHIVSPVIYNDAACNKIWFAGGIISFLRLHATHQKMLMPPTQELYYDTDYITGCVMVVHADVFKKIGLFDERFFLYYEDADLSLRARNVGYILGIVKDAKAYHHEVSENFKENKTYFLVLSGLLFFHKHAHGFSKIWFLCHLYLRKIKNAHDRKKDDPIALAVYKAYCDYEKQSK